MTAALVTIPFIGWGLAVFLIIMIIVLLLVLLTLFVYWNQTRENVRKKKDDLSTAQGEFSDAVERVYQVCNRYCLGDLDEPNCHL